jgi:hypothetical protein
LTALFDEMSSVFADCSATVRTARSRIIRSRHHGRLPRGAQDPSLHLVNEVSASVLALLRPPLSPPQPSRLLPQP